MLDRPTQRPTLGESLQVETPESVGSVGSVATHVQIETGELLPPDALPSPGTEVERNSVPWGQQDAHATAVAAVGMLRGTDGEARLDEPDLPREIPLNLRDVETRFVASTGARLKSRSQRQYWNTFKAFADDVRLARYTRRQLEGAQGKELILAYIPKVRPRS